MALLRIRVIRHDLQNWPRWCSGKVRRLLGRASLLYFTFSTSPDKGMLPDRGEERGTDSRPGRWTWARCDKPAQPTAEAYFCPTRGNARGGGRAWKRWSYCKSRASPNPFPKLNHFPKSLQTRCFLPTLPPYRSPRCGSTARIPNRWSCSPPPFIPPPSSPLHPPSLFPLRVELSACP